MMDLSVILPAYNERNRLTACVDRLERYLGKKYGRYEIVIVEDCSTDGSGEIADRISGSHSNVSVIHTHKRLGRGTSLVKGIKKSLADFVVYMDVDLATDIRHIQPLVGCLSDGASVATGSRLMKDSRATRPLSRDVASRSYNSLVRLLFGSRLHDHQCGFKGFNKRDVSDVTRLVRDNHWFWDTELLIICQWLGLRVDEFPVNWAHNGGDNTSTSKVKVLKDAALMGRKLLQLKHRLLTDTEDLIKVKNARDSRSRNRARILTH